MQPSTEQQKFKDDGANISFLDEKLLRLRSVIMEMRIKPARILATWLADWATYIENETSFSSRSLKAYKRGEIILMDFGFRIGAEMGGLHYAVVIENDNNPRSGTIAAIPLQSLKPGENVHPTNVFLGDGLIPGNQWGSQAIINQQGFFSKQRIIKPLVSPDRIGFISQDKLNEIEEKLKKKLLKREKSV